MSEICYECGHKLSPRGLCIKTFCARYGLYGLYGGPTEPEGTDHVAEDVSLLWDWRINKGMQFLASADDVPVLRSILAGIRLKDIPGFEWVSEDEEFLKEEPREGDSDWERHNNIREGL